MDVQLDLVDGLAQRGEFFQDQVQQIGQLLEVGIAGQVQALQMVHQGLARGYLLGALAHGIQGLDGRRFFPRPAR